MGRRSAFWAACPIWAKPIETDVRLLLKRIELHVWLRVRFGAERDYLIDPIEAGRFRLIADQRIDPLTFWHHGFEHLQDAENVFALALVVVGEPPRATIDLAPARIDFIVERARLET